MIKPKILSFNKNYYWLIVIGVVLYLIATISGNGYTSDGLLYKFIAQSIVSGTGCITWNGDELLYWVPLYPYILSAGYFLGGIDLYIWVLHLVFLAVTFAIWIRIADEEISENKTKTGIILFIIFNTSLLFCYVFVLSEAIFITSSGLYFYFISGWLKNGKFSDLIIATVSGFATLMLRNAGIFLLAGSFIYGLIYLFRKSERKGQLIFVAHTIVVFSGFSVWNIKKLLLGGHMDIITDMFPYLDILGNWNLISKSISANFIPFVLPQVFHSIFTLTLFAFFAYSLVMYKSEIRIQLLISVIFFYLLFWLIIPADQWNIERFLAPVFPALLVITAYFIEKSKILTKCPPWIFVLILLYPAIRILKNALFWGGFLKSFNSEDFLTYLY